MTIAPEQQAAVEEATAENLAPEAVTEDLIEEVSIDGMCGVY
ncbi:mycofactocin precursor MftA [Kribbia dieselivorans]|nr:mycofactocin precursor MftA [Kribbia dieselivorans]